MALPELQPMLASSGAIAAPEDQWAFEPKLDGWRALVYFDGVLRIRTRSGRDLTAALPELGPLAEALSGRSAILDGELVAGHGRGSDFYRLGPRVAAETSTQPGRRRTPVAFVAFDLLYLDGEVLTALAFAERRKLLEQLGLAGSAWCTVPSYPAIGALLFASCVQLGLEGLLAKRLSSPYRPGVRSRDWVTMCGHE